MTDIKVTVVSALLRFVALFLRGLIMIYRYGVSPILGPSCRYAPSCSAYAERAIHLHGPIRGVWLAIRRIGRCHPWGGSGYDPVPPTANPAPGTTPPHASN